MCLGMLGSALASLDDALGDLIVEVDGLLGSPDPFKGLLKPCELVDLAHGRAFLTVVAPTLAEGACIFSHHERNIATNDTFSKVNVVGKLLRVLLEVAKGLGSSLGGRIMGCRVAGHERRGEILYNFS